MRAVITVIALVALAVAIVVGLNAIPIGSADIGAQRDAEIADEAVAEHGHEGEPAAEHGDEVEDGHGHGEPRFGYIGLEPEEALDQHDLDEFQERVTEEAFVKANLDMTRFIIFGLLFILVFLAFASGTGLRERLTRMIDWYTLGTITGIILLMLVIPSGIVITFFYSPAPTELYSSVENVTRTPALAFFRNLHNWSSELFILLMLLHTARVVSTKTFLGKRKIVWLIGALLFVVGWLAFLGGTFMRGDQEALEGFEHMMFAFGLIPLGNYIADFFSGDLAVFRLTVVHISVATVAVLLMIVPHVLMRKVYVHVQKRWKTALIYAAVLTLLVVVQSLVMEAPFVRGLEGGPTVSGIETTKPPWPIYFLIAGENVFGAAAMVYSMLVFLPLLVFPYAVELLPFSRARKAKIGETAFYAGLFAMLALSYWAAAGKIITHIF